MDPTSWLIKRLACSCSRKCTAVARAGQLLVMGAVTLAAPAESMAYCLTADATPWSSSASKTVGVSTSFPAAMRSAFSNGLTNWNMLGSALVYNAPVYTASWQLYAFSAELRSFSGTGIPNTLPGYASGAGAAPTHSGGYLMLNSSFTWVNGSQNIAFNVADTETVVVHEVGHFNGMSHPTRCSASPPAAELASVMTAINSGTRRYPDTDDVSYQTWRY